MDILQQPSWLPRPHLIRRLEPGANPALTLLIAPAGYGKTGLLQEWAAGAAHPIVWGAPAPAAPADWLARLRAAGLPLSDSIANSWDAAWTHLFNAVTPLPGLTLILDDFPAAPPGLQQALSEKLDYLPSGLQLILAGRSEPALPLARLRVRRRLIELRAADLRLNEAEARAFLERRGEPADEPHRAGRIARAEGWLKGLQTTGDDPALAAYLEREVLAPQPEPIRRFLLQTAALLPPLDAACCNTGTGRHDCQHMLETLEAAGLFLFALDPERRTFRYHPLFAEFLRRRLR